MENTNKVRGSFDGQAEVGRKTGCGNCPSGCRVVCARGKEVLPYIREDDFDGFEVKFQTPDYGSFRNRRKKTNGS